VSAVIGSLVTGGVALVPIVWLLVGWRRAVRRAAALEVTVDALRSQVASLVEEIDALALAPPDMDEQRRVLERLGRPV
jgi:hypothetical protein